jgi:hypothetical protein
MHYVITGKSADGNVLYEGGWQNNRPKPMHAQYRFVENVFEELDAPSEWYLDRTNSVLYFYPPTGLDLENAVVETVRLKHLVEFRGSQDSPVRLRPDKPMNKAARYNGSDQHTDISKQKQRREIPQQLAHIELHAAFEKPMREETKLGSHPALANQGADRAEVATEPGDECCPRSIRRGRERRHRESVSVSPASR